MSNLTISSSFSFSLLLLCTASSHLWITLLCIVDLLNSITSLFNWARLLSLKQDTFGNVERGNAASKNEK